MFCLNSMWILNIFFLFLDRPWLVDHLDEWIQRLKGKSHKCAAIFVDNSGMDIVLGVIPFALELLKRKTKVQIHIYFKFKVITLSSISFIFWKHLKNIKLISCFVICICCANQGFSKWFYQDNILPFYYLNSIISVLQKRHINNLNQQFLNFIVCLSILKVSN